jgi:hypothetical protein
MRLRTQRHSKLRPGAAHTASHTSFPEISDGVPANSSSSSSFCRLKYLLGQSDIFSHFGVGGGKPSSSASAAASSAAAGPAKRGRRAAAQADEMDDDEKAMAKAAGGEDEGEDDSSPQGTVLLRQPSSVSGGQMR